MEIRGKKSSFVAYIDESGDEGFVFHADGSGSSRWFVLSAAVIRKENDLMMVSCLKDVRKILHKLPKRPLHFVDLKHEQRIPYIRRVGELPIRTVNILVYKPAIKHPEIFQNRRYQLYRYGTRLLLERVSWLCRDHRNEGSGDGFVEVIFSNRSNMSYEDIRSYLRLLMGQAAADSHEVRIDASVIDPERIRSVEHSKLAGLQVADAVASGIHFALKVNRYGETESGYLPHLRRTIYRHDKLAIGHGLKVWPENLAAIKARAPEARNLEGLL